MRLPGGDFAIELRELGHRFPGGYLSLQNINLTIERHTFVSIVGPSGSGKSTLLNLMAGLLAPSAGSVQVFGQPLTGLNREASYLFQRDGLLPWETTLDNVSLPLRIQGAALAEAREQARHWLDRVGLKGFENHYPAQLSGGMQKRAALAQCLIAQPPILLMDEPFSALDLHLRLRMEEMVLGLWKDLHTTIVFVTHDLDEAISLSDEVVILSTGPGSRVVDQFDIPLPRPRPLLDIRAEPGFQEIYARIWTKLRGEVLNRFAQGL